MESFVLFIAIVSAPCNESRPPICNPPPRPPPPPACADFDEGFSERTLNEKAQFINTHPAMADILKNHTGIDFLLLDEVEGTLPHAWELAERHHQEVCRIARHPLWRQRWAGTRVIAAGNDSDLAGIPNDDTEDAGHNNIAPAGSDPEDKMIEKSLAFESEAFQEAAGFVRIPLVKNQRIQGSDAGEGLEYNVSQQQLRVGSCDDPAGHTQAAFRKAIACPAFPERVEFTTNHIFATNKKCEEHSAKQQLTFQDKKGHLYPPAPGTLPGVVNANAIVIAWKGQEVHADGAPSLGFDHSPAVVRPHADDRQGSAVRPCRWQEAR